MPPSIKAEFNRAPISSIAAIIACFCAIGTLLTGVALAAQWTTSIEKRIEFNEMMDAQHHDDNQVHMPYERKVETFVTRPEWLNRGVVNERQFVEIKASQIRQENKIDKIYDILRDK